MTTTKRPHPTHAPHSVRPASSDASAVLAASTRVEVRRRDHDHHPTRRSVARCSTILAAAILSVFLTSGGERRQMQHAFDDLGGEGAAASATRTAGEKKVRRPRSPSSDAHEDTKGKFSRGGIGRGDDSIGGRGENGVDDWSSMSEIKFYPRWARAGEWQKIRRAGVRQRDERLREKAVGKEVGDGEASMTPSLIKLDDSTPPPELEKGCEAPLVVRPTCNSLHEIDFGGGLSLDLLRKVSKGSVRNVWSALEPHSGGAGGMSAAEREDRWKSKEVPFVLKTLRWTRDFIPPIYDKQRREAVALEYLTSSMGTTDIFGFCGASALNSYAGFGNLADYVRRTTREAGTTSLGPAETLTIATRVAEAVADVQDRGRRTTTGLAGPEGGVALQVVHRDIGASNVLVAGTKPLRILLDDFNQAYILRRHRKDTRSGKEICTYHDLFVCGEDGRRPDTRSPEECRGNVRLSQSIDTYGMGTILFYLLTTKRAYSFDAGAPGPPEEFPDWYRDRVKGGFRPELPQFVESHQNNAIVAVRKAMQKAMTSDVEKRPTAKSIAYTLLLALRQYRTTALKPTSPNKAK